MAEALTQYKLIVLYMLERVDFPLTNTQISDFILGKDYTDYFTLQQTINELISSGLISTQSTHNNTHCRITSAGRETLSFFPDKISDAIKKDVYTYFEDNHLELKKEFQLLADFYKTTDQGYAARCQVKKGNISYIDLTIRTATKEQAEAICANWQNQNEEVYGYLMDLLVK